ncbi:PqiC family protein [Aeromonas schubertii]|uniref:PqiC family protein n=1 Tax=Aeromonas schubertii TaxID=652 RepID=UPI001CC3F239|nr:PqiC family protein [Aeromonas schubertii]MBZ6074177.1 PqiC family protein [Aeromonas schubertii]
MTRRMTILLLALGLGACSANVPTVHYYSLGLPQGKALSTAPRHELRLAPLSISEQVDSVSLVYELEGHELTFTERHRWAGTLDDQLEQLTLSGLSSRLPGWALRESGGSGNRLAIRLQQFAGRHDGMAVLSGRWSLEAADGRVLLDRPFSQVRPLPADGYNALVGELAKGWNQLLDEIASEVVRY